MSQESNKAIVRRLFEQVVARRDYAGLETLISPDFVDHNGRRSWAAGAEGLRDHVEFLHGVFPDLRILLDELIAEGDRVVVFWRLEGEQRGELWGVPASGRRVSGATTSLVTLREGRILEYEARPDRLGFLLQLGAAGEHAQALGLGG
jgi:predicted ester cyclase